MPNLKAALFDLGGVLTSSPVIAIRQYAIARGVDYSILGPMIAEPQLAWSRWERSEISADQFMLDFEREGYDRGITISARGVMDAAFGGQSTRDEVVAVVRHLKGKVRLGAITNNVVREGSQPRETSYSLDELFEVVIESSVVGLRKPDPRIYQLACERLGVVPEECVFLDDIGANLKGARALGMTTIKVNPDLGLIDELEAALGIPLPRP
ncbi:MAG: HAD family hydrolase [Dehalococcoidia bacterium]